MIILSQIILKSARNCFKNILCKVLPVNCPREVTKLNYLCVFKSFLEELFFSNLDLFWNMTSHFICYYRTRLFVDQQLRVVVVAAAAGSAVHNLVTAVIPHFINKFIRRIKPN